VSRDGSVPLRLGFTEFPGLEAQLGEEELRLPDCGCDACDEDVLDLLAMLEHAVSELTDNWPRRPREHLEAFNAHDTERLLDTFAIAAFFTIRAAKIRHGKVYRQGSADL
jgi:hypothetical protein